jgi:hypothetical protein
MQNKKLILSMGVLVLLVGVAAFLAGRMLNNKVNPLGLFGLDGGGISTDILAAEELPKTPPEVSGLFVERQDNIIFVQASQPNDDIRGVEVGSPADVGGGPKVEVVVTTETIVYRDTTQPPSQRPTSDNNPPIQQTVEEGTLDDLNNSQSLVMVWGRKSGDRIISEVLVYSNPVYLQKP